MRLNTEKRILLGLLIVAVLLCILFGVSWNERKDFAINFLVGILGAIVIVLILEPIIASRRDKLLEELNKHIASRIAGSIKIAGFETFLQIGEVIPLIRPFRLGSSDKEIINKFRDQKNREKILNLIGENFSVFNSKNMGVINSVADTFSSLYSILSVLSKDIKPYPDPKITEGINGFNISSSMLRSYHRMEKTFLDPQMGKEEREEIIKNKLNPFLSNYFDEFVKLSLLHDFKVMIELYDRAEGNKIACCLE